MNVVELKFLFFFTNADLGEGLLKFSSELPNNLQSFQILIFFDDDVLVLLIEETNRFFLVAREEEFDCLNGELHL